MQRLAFGHAEPQVVAGQAGRRLVALPLGKSLPGAVDPVWFVLWGIAWAARHLQQPGGHLRRRRVLWRQYPLVPPPRRVQAGRGDDVAAVSAQVQPLHAAGEVAYLPPRVAVVAVLPAPRAADGRRGQAA